MNLRNTLKKIPGLKKFYFSLQYLKNLCKSFFVKLKLKLFYAKDFKMLKELQKEVRSFYPLGLNFTNPTQFYCGKNLLDYPALANIEKDGKSIGWANTQLTGGFYKLPFLQVQADFVNNFPAVFEKYKPKVIVDFGTASGGSAVFFYNLAVKYTQPKILSIDISDKDFKNASDFHKANRTQEKVQFLFKSSLECAKEVEQFLKSRQPKERVLLSFDDAHSYEHTYEELEIYAPLLQSGDVILMQDTWDQSLFGHETSPMLAVHKFLNSYPDFSLDREFLQQVVLPSNFIHGLLVKN